MVGVVFFYEDSTINRQSGREVDVQVWRETIKPFGPDTMIMIDLSQSGSTYQHTDEEILFERHKSLEAVLKKYPDHSWVFTAPEVSIPGSNVYDKEPAKPIDYIEIKNLIHPKNNVIYVIGPDSTGLKLPTIKFPKKSQVVTIPTKRNHDLWSFVVAGIVLFDRKNKLKLWQ